MDKYDISQLTEFPRFAEETPQSGVTTFFNKIWKLPLFSPSETSDNLQSKAGSDDKQDASQSLGHNKEEYDDTKTETGAFAVELEGRSLPNVLRRISSLIALGTGASTRYADTELARYWMPDDVALECYECAARFSALRRRHHCRVCGQIFCSRCCSQRVPGHIFGCTGGLRVCTYCCNVVLSYLKENELSGEMSTDLRALQENLQIKFPTPPSSQPLGRESGFMFAREDERAAALVSQAVPLHDIYKQLLYQVPTSLHRYRLVRYSGVWRGCELIQWVMDHTSSKTRAQATQVCQNLLRGGWIASVTELPHFADYSLYRPAMLPNTTSDTPEEENNRLVESVSSYCLDLNVEDSSARLIRTAKPESNSTPTSEEDHPVTEGSEQNEDTPISRVCRSVSISGAEHLQLLLRQCLARAALPAAWAPILHQLCARAAQHTQPDIYGSDIDIRNYVQVKKIPDGDMKDSCVVPGVVITKNVAHRGMPQQLTNPTVLLLDCSIAYQRVEGKLTSLEPVLLQEQEYLSRCAARVRALGARLVLVRGSAARGVQDALRVCGVSLAQNVRAAALRRAARCARADVLTSIDARIGTPRLGTCASFYVSNFPSKTVIVLEGCAEPNLGCCILLRGASLQELVRVKKVVKFMLLAYYNWKLEKAFLGDIEAVLPEAGATFEDDNAENGKETVSNESEQEKDTQNETEPKTNDDTNKQTKADDVKDVSNNLESKTIDDTQKQQNDKGETVVLNKEQKTIEDEKQNKPEDIDDPLQKPKAFRKNEDRNSSCTVPIRDFSDPLRSNLSVDDDNVFPAKVEENLVADETNARWSTDDAVLSMSPNVVIPAPQQRVPPPAPPPRHPPHTPRPARKAELETKVEQHPFIKQPISSFADDLALRTSLAHYRATGGGVHGHLRGCPFYNPSIIKKEIKEPTIDTEKEETLDPLAPQHHQQLSILLYSFSPKSPNVPDFCVNPWIVTMDMYGRHDISLGGFLEKYCFNGEYKCSSNNCNVATNQHIRKFVHEDVCITISCNTVGHSHVDKLKEEQSKHVMFWSRCERCHAVSPMRRLSSHALSLSLAQYIRLRCAAPRYARASVCRHPLHAHAHAFVSRLTTATFRYSKISQFCISLPPSVVAPRYDTALMRDALIGLLNDLMLRGHETFSGVPDSEADKDYQAFKQHMEQIHLALTSSHLQEQTSFAAVVKSLWSVSDRIIFGEKMLRDAQEKWSSPAVKTAKTQPESTAEEKSDLEESSDTGNSDNGGTTYTFESKESEREHNDDDEERGDKKTVRQILTQLLSNSTNSNQSMIVSSGVVPVVVLAGEIGSVIAATLASVTYLRTLRANQNSAQSEQEEAESSKDKTDGDKKAAKSNDHIGVLLKDGLICRVYYAPQFLKLRHALLAPLARNPHISDAFARPTTNNVPVEVGQRCSCDEAQEKGDYKTLCDVEEGFIRSLAHCVPWAARGGKSGSTFCKTKDDRYVLKEMTKQEWQRFLEFAPHYFSYVNACRQNGQPSLLARILGVFGVGGLGPGVLVMENIWWGCGPRAPRYDLKGCPRRAPDPPPAAAATAAVVQMDEGLLHCRWESPLFISGAQGVRLRAAAERDTAFLASHGVMDYSLLLGVDGKRLVVGIIDYIRTFTWDKKLEHLVKKNLGSGQPTVVSPEEYKRRFSAAIRKYFLECPAHWDHLLSPANEEEKAT